MTSIRLFRGGFGYVSLLSVASDLVTHAHAEAHLIVWLDGSPGTMHVGDAEIAPGPGTAVGVNSFQPHSHSFEAGSTPGHFLAFYIDPEWAALRFGLPCGAPLFRQPAIPIDAWVRSLCGGLFERGEGDAGDLTAYEVERLIETLVEMADTPRTARRTGAAPSDHRVRKAVELMHANISGRISFDEVARAVGLSRPHFFALFKEQTSLTPNVYWNTLRMQEALRQLQWSSEPLTSVAWNLGFTTQGNFTRFFRDHAGVPPTLYREAMQSAA